MAAGAAAQVSSPDEGPTTGGRVRLPAWVLALALGAALLHLLPFLATSAQTPSGWTFTGNISVNPDIMQYRVWFRQTQVEGPLVTDTFTTEPNRPHLLVLYHYAYGKLASWLSVSPEAVYAYAGSVLAFLLVVLVFVTVAQFTTSAYQQVWIVLGTVVGGGAGAHLKQLMRPEAVKSNLLVKRMFFEPLQQYLVFEDLRGQYVFTTLFDTHFLLFWVMATGCVLSLYWTLRRYSAGRVAVTAALYGAMTLLHLYDGVTLVAITMSIAVLCASRGVAARAALVTTGVTTGVVVVLVGAQVWLATKAGIPVPDWRPEVVLPTILFLAYPLAWVLAAWGVGVWWRDGSLASTFLLGWVLGCTLLTLSGPFYPYPLRGTLTLQIPLSILAGLTYFRIRPRVSLRAALVAVFLLGVTPSWYMVRMAANTRFDPDAPAIHMDADHRAVVQVLSAARRDAVLLADRQSLLWLAPDYPGRHYSAHFFLTVDFERKQREVAQFFRASASEQAAFLSAQRIAYVFTPDAQVAARLREVEGLRAVLENSAGTVFAYDAGTGRTQ